MRRNEQLITGEIYHVFNKSIAGYEIFNSESDFLRIKQMILYYSIEKPPMSFSNFLQHVSWNDFGQNIYELKEFNREIIQIIAYCIMPTHLHLVVKQLKDNGVERAVGNILNSYTRYFNLKRKRKGPLWVSRFKNVRVESDEQLLHLTRYVHLNPVTAGIVKNPLHWYASSYHEYVQSVKDNLKISSYKDILEINPSQYAKFVQDGVEYQKELARIKNFLLEEQVLPKMNLRGSRGLKKKKLIMDPGGS